MIYIKHKEKNICNGVEKEVKEKIVMDDQSFFPIGRAIAIETREQMEVE